MRTKERWLEPHEYRKLTRREYRRERLLRQFMQRLVGMLVLFVAVAILVALHPYFSGQR